MGWCRIFFEREPIIKTVSTVYQIISFLILFNDNDIVKTRQEKLPTTKKTNVWIEEKYFIDHEQHYYK